MPEDNNKGAVLLIHPPVVRPCEPPAGIARIASAMRRHGIDHRILDANLEGILYLLNNQGRNVCSNDTWTRRAVKNASNALSRIRSRHAFDNPDRYRRDVSDLNRVLSRTAHADITVGLANYEDQKLSPLKSSDLLCAAEDHESSPFFPYFSRRLYGLLEDADSSIIGFSINYLSQALPAFAMMGFLRRHYPKVRIIAGGGLVTSWLKRPDWHNRFCGIIDAMVAGPGESYFLDGLAKSGKIHPSFSFPCLALEEYLSPGPVIPFSASSGCWWRRCAFCPETSERNDYLSIPASSLTDEVIELKEQTHPALIHFLDNALSPSHLSALARMPACTPWYGFARFSEELADPDFCLDLKKSGCVMLQLGLESGSQKVLDALGKGIKLETASRVLKSLRNAGIASYVYLLFGTPPESAAEAGDTLDFTAARADQIGFLNVALFNLPAFSPEAEKLSTYDFYEGDLFLYKGFHHPSGWDRPAVRNFLDREFRRHRAIAPIIAKDPPVFTSSHAPFLVMRHPG